MQVTIPEKISFKDGNGDGAGQFLCRLAAAHNATDGEFEDYRKHNSENIKLLFDKIDGLRTWIMGVLVSVILAGLGAVLAVIFAK